MQLVSKCNCCAAEKICKYKELYEKAAKQILDSCITVDVSEHGVSFITVRDADFISVNIKCPNMLRHSMSTETSV